MTARPNRPASRRCQARRLSWFQDCAGKTMHSAPNPVGDTTLVTNSEPNSAANPIRPSKRIAQRPRSTTGVNLMGPVKIGIRPVAHPTPHRSQTSSASQPDSDEVPARRLTSNICRAAVSTSATSAGLSTPVIALAQRLGDCTMPTFTGVTRAQLNEILGCSPIRAAKPQCLSPFGPFFFLRVLPHSDSVPAVRTRVPPHQRRRS